MHGCLSIIIHCFVTLTIIVHPILSLNLSLNMQICKILTFRNLHVLIIVILVTFFFHNYSVCFQMVYCKACLSEQCRPKTNGSFSNCQIRVSSFCICASINIVNYCEKIDVSPFSSVYI